MKASAEQQVEVQGKRWIEREICFGSMTMG
jgi:hypothetical protein